MKLELTYADKETRTKFRTMIIDVPQITSKKFSLDTMTTCQNLANKNCKEDEYIMNWKLLEEK